MKVSREIAKFLSGAEAFHAMAHAYFWLNNMTVTMLGITATPETSMYGAALNAVLSMLLALYGWEIHKRQNYSFR